VARERSALRRRGERKRKCGADGGAGGFRTARQRCERGGAPARRGEVSRHHDEAQRSQRTAAWSAGCLPRGRHAGRRAWQRQSGDRGGRKLNFCNARPVAPALHEKMRTRDPWPFSERLLLQIKERGEACKGLQVSSRCDAGLGQQMRVRKCSCRLQHPPAYAARLAAPKSHCLTEGCRAAVQGCCASPAPCASSLRAHFCFPQLSSAVVGGRASAPLLSSLSHSVYAASMGPSVTVGSPRRSAASRSGRLSRSLALLLFILSACLLHTLAVEQAHAAGSSGAGTNPRPTLLAARTSASRRLHTCGTGCLYPKIAVGAFASAPLCVRFLFSLPYLAFATSQPPFAYGICEAVGCNCAPPFLACALFAALCSSELL